MPTLQFINKPKSAPSRVRLFKKITTLGRDNTNDIPLVDESVDKNHAYIVFDGKHYTISTVSKKSGMVVNGKKEKSYTLTHKDIVTLGDVNFSFDLYDESLHDDQNALAAEIAGYRKLYEFTEKLIGTHELEKLLEQLIDLVIEVTNADNGFLILRRDDRELDFMVARNLNKEKIDNAIRHVSDSIISRVLQTRKAVIVSDALNDEAFKDSASVLSLQLASVMCVPLIARGNLLGIIYVGSNNIIHLFTSDKLQLLETFAGQAALLIQNALLLNELKLDKKELADKLNKLQFGSMIGQSEAITEIFRKIDKIAGIDVPVLIQGETGTGKELVAREIHDKSLRKDGPFVVINCGAIPRELLESELFGHVKGSFTGAVANKPGKFRVAQGGTLFLDEIGDMPLELQVKMLRVLEEHRVVAVGDTKPIDVDIRVIAATNKPLEQATADGEFREDLFYRLNVITIWLPPLRERNDDSILLAKYFLSRYAAEYDRKLKGFSSRAIEEIRKHPWPGNVRELENRIKKAVIMTEKSLIEPELLDLSGEESRPIKPLAIAREEFQIEYIQRALKAHGGNRTKTAQALDVDPRTIFRYLEKMQG